MKVKKKDSIKKKSIQPTANQAIVPAWYGLQFT